MDPHSRLSQFNHRTPKSGPQNSRFMEAPLPKPSLATFPGKQSRKSSATTPSSSSLLLVRRPIATNSRVKQDEKYRNEMYLSFITSALQEKAIGRSERFDDLVNQFNPKAASQTSAQLRAWILTLSHVVSRLERVHYALIEAIVRMPWTTMDTATVKSYTIFIGMLLSARPEYLSLVLGMIAQGFTYQSCAQALDASASSGPITRRTVYDRLHYLLQHILSLIPTLPSTLMPLLSRNFPHKRQNISSQSTYIRNLLRVCGYCPELSDKILGTIVDRAIQIDVEIQVELEELEEAEAEQDQEVFELDPFDVLIGQEGHDSDTDSDDGDGDDFSDLSSDAGGDLDLDNHGQPEATITNVRHIQDMVKKLDTILTLTFEHFDRSQSSTPKPPSPSPPTSLPPLDLPPLPPVYDSFNPLAISIQSPTPSIPSPPPPITQAPSTPLSSSPAPPSKTPALHITFNSLLAIFDRTILLTFKSRYTQFLLFWYTSLDSDFADIFLGMLIDRALINPSTSTVTRAAAASYIGSFVSRARFVDREGVRTVIRVLCDFLATHLDNIEHAGSADSAQNSIFYAVSQSLFLVFCFRWRDMQEDEDEDIVKTEGKKWMRELSVVHRVVNSSLNPLKVCSPNVAMQFARVANSVGFMYCYTVLETNKRQNALATVAPTRIFTSAAVNAELNTFFPFDPYKLPRSGVYIEGIYREWGEVAIDEDEDDEDEDDEEDEDEMRDTFDEGGIPVVRKTETEEDPATQGLGESLDAMSISPVRPRNGI
ncbi:RNA polymerase I-specific transcription initiation factor RRN3 [Armillaria gallica]|uniref:RNA polymerase I-specific transcription initiation factor RRN3 n=1 Tax=Armillaria gallica TaxID=47427 RepID=A0A2H3EHV4_ARMGA|nr:RNA polymerase I-specific transcription initiation factor RRN3 [Armillaria gallica]